MDKKTKKLINKIGIMISIVFILFILLLFVIQKYNNTKNIAYVKTSQINIKENKINSGNIIDKIEELKKKIDLNKLEIIKNYIINDETKTIEINEYIGEEDVITISDIINGYKIVKIDENAFKNCENLEKIRIPKSLQNLNIKIKYFEINPLADDEEYIEYITTKEYNESYLKYLELTEEEKKEIEAIPSKFYVPVEEAYTEEFEELYEETSLSTEYDMRDYIKIGVESQKQYGNCYAYATLTAIETNIALRNRNTAELDLSEIHAAIMTKQYGGGTFITTINQYGEKGPSNESDWPMNEFYMTKDKVSTVPSTDNKQIVNRLMYDFEGVTETEINKIENAMNKSDCIVSVDKTVKMPSITPAMKEAQDTNIETIRTSIKKHLIQYGSLYCSINAKGIVNGLNGHKKVLYYNGPDGTNHGVSIIGWDDNFSKYNFPEENRPKNNGAYLVLNSWGENWGNGGYFWISYEDKHVESRLYGVISASLNVSSISISKLPNKQKYYVNDKVNTEGLELNVTYNDGTTKKITKGFECTPTILNKAGTQEIIVTYGGRKATFNVTVEKKTIDMSEVEFNNKTVTYNGKLHSVKIQGELPNGIDGVTYVGNEKTNAGEYEVIAKFNVDTNVYNSVPNKTAKLIIKKAEPIVNPIYNKEVDIYEGDALPEIKLSSGDTEGTIEWKEYKTTVENKEYFWLYTPKDTTNYNSKTGKENINVIKVVVMSINIKTKPKKTNYYVDDIIDTTGLIITVIYNNGKTEDITSGFECTPKILSKAGTQEILVTYGGKETKFNVTVGKKTIDMSEVQFNNKTVTYNGKLHSIKIEGGLPKEIDSVVYVGNEKINAGEYEVTAKFEVDTIKYNEIPNKTAKLIIEKAEPIVNPMYDKEKILYIGDELPKISLSQGDTEGTIKWDEYEIELGTKEYSWTFTPLDITNYNSKKGKISFTVKQFENKDILIANSKYQYDEEGEKIFITKIMPKTSIEEYKIQIRQQYQVEIYDIENNKVLDEKDNVKTGMKMKVYINEKEQREYILIVTGDCNANGTTNVADLTKLMMSRAESLSTNKDNAKILKGEYAKAGDLNGDGKISVADITKLCMFIAENK